MTANKPSVSFIGLGAMGFGMATHLVSRGYRVTGFDVWEPTLTRFVAAGGLSAATPADAVRSSPFCVVMVATAAQAESVLVSGPAPAAPALPQGATVLLCSTVPCAYVQGLAARLARPDVRLVDCPVSGGAARAADGTLSIMAGGDPAALESAGDLLRELADPAKLYVVAGGVGAGSNMKMCHQVLAAVHILAASEGMGFAARLGVGAARARDAVLASRESWAWMFENRVPRMLEAEGLGGPVASALTIILKDAGIITSEARRRGFATPMTSTAEQVFFSGLGRGWGADDDSSMIRLYTEGEGKVGPVTTAETEDEEAKLKHVMALLKGIYLCAAAETIAFAKRCELDLDQVYELCVNAAGGSAVFKNVGPEMVKLCRGEALSAAEGGESLGELEQELLEAVAEAQRLKMPVYLGSQALSLIRLALQHAPRNVERIPRASVAKLWAL
ncbi:NAD binding domain of 6-phosphogluconate dehydrogenase-domain-containing protein [Biscogniauxia sp. FL1348]|nr:NAD binding domain of 6-phosphogluconate dehydrogenase-domain-containing protein [Biscogniauxia sp. FL1348]